MTSARAVGGLLVIISVAVTGCGGDDDGSGPPADGGPPDGAAGVAAPVIPWLEDGLPPLELTPCPDGWREVVDDDGITTCDPYPEAGPSDCALGEAHFPGEPECRPVGTACPTGAFPDAPTDDVVLYVDASAAPGGDGSRAAPFAALADIRWAGLGPGTTVVLAKGSYAGIVTLRPGVRLLGACAAETSLLGEDTLLTAVVQVTGTGAPSRLEHIGIRDAPVAGVSVDAGGKLDATGVMIERVRGIGLIAESGLTEVSFADVVVRGTLPLSDGRFGLGAQVAGGASLTVDRALFEGNRVAALFAVDADTTVTMTNTAIVDSLPQVSDGQFGTGIAVDGGATLNGSALLITGSHLGACIPTNGAAVTLSDSLITDNGGRGIGVGENASMDVVRVVVSRSAEVNVLYGGAGTRGELTDVVIRDGDEGSSGFYVQDGASVTASRMVVERVGKVGIAIVDATLTLSDAVVRNATGVEGVLDIHSGHGIDAFQGAAATLSRILVERNRSVGIIAGMEGTSLDLTDVVIRNMQPRLDSRFGYGLAAQVNADVNGQRIVVDDVYELGVASLGGARMDLSDVVVRGVRESAVTDPDRRFGFAATALSSELVLTDFHLSDSASCGFIISPAELPGERLGEPSLDAASGIVEGMPIGACVQVDDYDLDRLQVDVSYRDNGTNLDATELPVPGITARL